MNPDGDPEARIADLERSMAQPAPTGGAAAAAGAGGRLGWIVLGLLIAALIVSGGLILAGRGSHPVPGRPAVAPTTPMTGPPTPSAAATPRFPSPTTTASPRPGRGGTTTVSGVKTQQTIACADGVLGVTISGVQNSVVVTGRCERVEVSGIENQVTIDETGTIEVSGLRNEVRFRSGAPELTRSGIGNTVGRG